MSNQKKIYKFIVMGFELDSKRCTLSEARKLLPSLEKKHSLNEDEIVIVEHLEQ